MRSALALGIPVVIVTNNSAEAVKSYLDRHILGESITGMSTRVRDGPDLMKPYAYLVLKGPEMAGQPAAGCLLIGDSPTDMQAAKKAGARCVGHAKRTVRTMEISEAGAEVVFQSTEPMADAVIYLTV